MSSMSIHQCPLEECGRKFPSKEKLEEHIERRHEAGVKRPSSGGNELPRINTPPTNASTSIGSSQLGLLSTKSQYQLQRNSERFNNKSLIPKLTDEKMPPITIASSQQLRPRKSSQPKKDEKIEEFDPASEKAKLLKGAMIKSDANKSSLKGPKEGNANKLSTKDDYNSKAASNPLREKEKPSKNSEDLLTQESKESKMSSSLIEKPRRESSADARASGVVAKKPKEEQYNNSNVFDERTKANSTTTSFKDSIDINYQNFDEFFNISGDMDKAEPYNVEEEERKLEEKDRINMEEIFEAKKKLTTEYVLKKSGFEKLEEITQLVLRDEKLLVFEETAEFPIETLYSLEFLSLSHNRLFSLYGVSQCITILELNINFNQVTDIYPLAACLNLRKLWANNNKIRTISPLSELTDIEVLSISKNKIKSFDETLLILSKLLKLKELDLEGNPCTKRFSYKYDLLWTLQLEKLDGETVNEVDYEVSRMFKNEMVNHTSYDINAPALQRPSTAPGRVRGANLNSSYTDRFKTKMYSVLSTSKKGGLNDIPENSERFYELEQEIELLRHEREDMKKKIDALEARESELNQKVINLSSENAILKVESNSVYIIMDQNNEFKSKIAALEETLASKFNPDQQNLASQIPLLHMKIEELLKENQKLKNSGAVDGEKALRESAIHRHKNSSPENKLRNEDGNPKPTVIRRPLVRNSSKEPVNNKRGEGTGLDKEIEELLMRNSIQLSSIRKEIRDMNELAERQIDSSRVEMEDDFSEDDKMIESDEESYFRDDEN